MEKRSDIPPVSMSQQYGQTEQKGFTKPLSQQMHTGRLFGTDLTHMLGNNMNSEHHMKKNSMCVESEIALDEHKISMGMAPHPQAHGSQQYNNNSYGIIIPGQISLSQPTMNTYNSQSQINYGPQPPQLGASGPSQNFASLFKKKNESSMLIENTITKELTSIITPSNNKYNSDSKSMTAVVEELEPYDAEELHNPQRVSVYATDITNHLRACEEKLSPKENYIKKNQTDINEKMRAILIDWLVDVHHKFKLLPETLFLCVNLIDRYLERVSVPRQKLQLVGVAAMLIACKYEEIYAPEVKDFVYVTDQAYTKAEILEMEGNIISVLEFNLAVPTSYKFFERYSFIAKLDEQTTMMARYIIELALVEYEMLKFLPSQLSCGAIYLANKIFKREGWSITMMNATKYIDSEVRVVVKSLYLMLTKANSSALKAVRRKFSLPAYCSVSQIDIEAL